MKLKTPTFSQLLAEYPRIAQVERMKSESPCPKTVENVLSGVRLVVEAVAKAENGCAASPLTLESPVSELTRARIDHYLASAGALGISPVSAWTYVSHLRGVSARWTRSYYAVRGWSVPQFDIPPCRRRTPRYARPDRETLLKVKDWYDSLLVRADKRDWIAVTLMLEFAMRNGDAGRLRWSDFRGKEGAGDAEEGASAVLCYTPNKTALSSGRVVAWPVHPDIWRQLVLIRAQTGERVGTHFQGLVLPAAHEVFMRLNREIGERAFFPYAHKRCYELRKICIDHIYQKFGAEMASSISGDDIRTVMRYYADPSAVNVEGVRVVDLL